MKSWLIKFKISNALNDHRPLPPAVERTINQSEELRRFAENTSTVDHALKSQLPGAEDCPLLHESIMRAVRTSLPTRVAEQQPFWPRWIPVSSFGALVVLGIFFAFKFFPNPGIKVQPGNPHTLAAAGSAIEMGGSLVREASSVAMSPLSDEMQKLDRNMTEAKQFLLASLP